MDYGSDSNDVSEEDPFEDNSHYIYSTEEMQAYETGIPSPAFTDGHASKICISNKAVKRKCPEDESPKIGSNVDCEESEKTLLKRKKYSMLETMKNDKREGNWEKFNRFKEKRNALRPKTTTQRESKVKETNRKLENSNVLGVRKNETKSPGRPKKLLEKRMLGSPKKLPKGEGLPERHEMLLVKKFPGRPKKVTKKNPGRPKKLLEEEKGLPEKHEMLLLKKCRGRPKKITKESPGRPNKLLEKRRAGRPKKLPEGKGLPERHEMLLVKKFPGRPKKVTKKSPGRPKKLLEEEKGLPEKHEMLLLKKCRGRPKKITKESPGRPNKLLEKRRAGRPKKLPEGKGLPERHEMLLVKKFPGRPKKVTKKSPGRPKKLLEEEKGLPEKHEMLLLKKCRGRPKKITKESPGRPNKLLEKRRAGRPKKLPEGKGLPERHEMLLVKKFPGRPKKVTKKSPGRPKKLLEEEKGLPEKHEMLLLNKCRGRPKKITKESPGRPNKLLEKRKAGRPKKLPEGKGLPEKHEMLLVKKFPGRPKKVTKNPGRPKKLLEEEKGLPEKHEMLLLNKCRGRPKKITKESPGRPNKLLEKRKAGRPKKLPEGKGLPERHEMLLVKKFPDRPKKSPGRPKKSPISEIEKNYGWTKSKGTKGRAKISTSLEINKDKSKGLSGKTKKSTEKQGPSSVFEISEPENIKRSRGRPRIDKLSKIERPKRLYNKGGSKILDNNSKPVLYKSISGESIPFVIETSVLEKEKELANLPEEGDMPKRANDNVSSDNIEMDKGIEMDIDNAKSPGKFSPKVKESINNEEGSPEINTEIETNSERLEESTTCVNENYGKGEKKQDFPVLKANHEDKETLHTDQCVTSTQAVSHITVHSKKNQATKSYPTLEEDSEGKCIEEEHSSTSVRKGKGTRTFSKETQFESRKRKKEETFSPCPGPSSVGSFEDKNSLSKKRSRKFVLKLPICGEDCDLILKNCLGEVPHSPVDSYFIDSDLENLCSPNENNLPEVGDIPKKAKDNASSENIEIDKDTEMNVENDKSPGKSSPKVKESFNNEEGSPEINNEIETNSERLEESTTCVNENYGKGEKKQDFPVLKANHEDKETLHTDQCVTSTQAVSYITVHSKKNQATKSYPTLEEDSEGKCIEEEHSSTSVRKGKGTRTFSKETQFESRKRKKEETFSPCPGPSSVGSFEDENSLPKKRSRKFVFKFPICGEDCDLILKNCLGEVPHSPVDSYFIDSDLENLCSPNENNLPEVGDIPKKAKDNASSDNIEIDKDIEMDIDNAKSPGKSSPKVKESFNNEEGSPEINTEIETNSERLEESTTCVNENYGKGEKKQDFPVLKANHEDKEALHTDQCVTSTQAVSHITVHSKKNQATKSYPTLEEDSEGKCIEEEHSSTSVRKGKGTRTFSKETQFESRKRKKEETFSPCPGPSSVGSFEDKNSLSKKRSRKFVLKLPICGEDCDLILKNCLGEVPHSPVDSYFIDSDLENLCSPNENNLPEVGDIPKKAKDNASSENIEIDKDTEMNVENDKSPGKSSPKVKESFNNEEGSPEINTEIETNSERLEEPTTCVNENYGKGEKKQDFPVLKANHEDKETLHTDQCVASTQAVSHITVHSKKNQATKSYPTLEEDSEGKCIEEEHSSTSVRKGKGTRTFSKETQFESRKRKKEETFSPCPGPSSVGSFEDENSLPKKRSRKFVFKFPTCREDFDFELVLKKFLGEVPQSPIDSYFIDCDLENLCSPNENNLPEEGDIPKKTKDNASSDNIEIDKDTKMNVENDKSPGKSSPKVKESFNNEEGSPEINNEIETNSERLEESTTCVNENYGKGEKKQDFPVLKANHEDKETLHTDQCVTSTQAVSYITVHSKKNQATKSYPTLEEDSEGKCIEEEQSSTSVRKGKGTRTFSKETQFESRKRKKEETFSPCPGPSSVGSFEDEESDDDPESNILPKVKYPSVVGSLDPTHIAVRKWEKLLLAERSQFQRYPKESFLDLDGDEYHILSEEEEDQVEKLPSTSKRRRIGRKCGVSRKKFIF